MYRFVWDVGNDAVAFLVSWLYWEQLSVLFYSGCECRFVVIGGNGSIRGGVEGV